MKRSIKISQKFFDELLKRTTMYDIIDAISSQNGIFENDEKLVLLGSALASFESNEYKDATPIHRAPSDIDFYLHEPRGEKGKFGSRINHNERCNRKEEQSDKMRRVLRQAADSLKARIHERMQDDEGMDIKQRIA